MIGSRPMTNTCYLAGSLHNIDIHFPHDDTRLHYLDAAIDTTK